MSQIPPPPMYPPGGAYQAPTPPPRPASNGMAITSLVCGLLMCIPGITGLLAILFGFLGLRRAKEPGVGGRGLAIVGIVLGVISLVGWISFGVGAYKFGMWAVNLAKPAVAQTEGLLRDLSNGDVSAARARCVSGIDVGELEASSRKLSAQGAYKEMKVNSFNLDATAGVFDLAGQAVLQNGSVPFRMKLVKQGDTYMVKEFHVE